VPLKKLINFCKLRPNNFFPLEIIVASVHKNISNIVTFDNSNLFANTHSLTAEDLFINISCYPTATKKIERNTNGNKR
jgi:hypothetical protein